MNEQGSKETSPEVPRFAGPEGYEPSTLKVWSDRSPVPKEAAPGIIAKTPNVGTFVVTTPAPKLPSNYRVTPPVKAVGREVRSIETELQTALEKERVEKELISDLLPISVNFTNLRHNADEVKKLLKNQPLLALLEKTIQDFDELFEDAYNDPTEEKLSTLRVLADTFADAVEKAEQEVAMLPKEKTESEKRLEEKEKEATLIKDMLPVASEFAALKKEVDAIATSVNNPPLLMAIDALCQEWDKTITLFTSSPTEKLFDESKQLLKKLRERIAEAHKSIVATPKVAPSIAPAATPAVAPKPPEPLREYGGWPSNVYYKKASKGQAAGWYSSRHDRPLPEQEVWESENQAFKTVFKRYMDFIRSLSVEKRRVVKPLIDIKNKLIDAIKSENILSVEALRAELDEAVDTWEERWKRLIKANKIEEAFLATKTKGEKVEKLLDSKTELDNLVAKKREIEETLQKAKSATIDGNEKAEELTEKVEKLLTKYTELISKYETVNKALKRDVLRPIKVTDANRRQKIKPLGRPEMTLGEYEEEQKIKQEEGSKTVLTDEIMDEWPELKAAGYDTGSPINKKELTRFQAETMYDRMFIRDQNDFLARYTVPSLDPTTNTIRYTESKALKTHSSKEYIVNVLNKHGITLSLKTDTERKKEDKKEALEKQIWRDKHSITFHPSLVKKAGLFGKGDEGLRMGYTSTKPGAKTVTTLETEQERYEKLKAKREKYLTHPSNYRFAESEKDITKKLEQATEKKGTWQEKGALGKLEKVIDAYEQDATPLIKNQIEERELPQNEEERKKRMEAIAKIDAILKTRVAKVEKKTENVRQRRLLQALIFSIAVGAVNYDKVLQSVNQILGTPPVAEQGKETTVNQKEQAIMNYVGPEYRALAKSILEGKTRDEIVRTYARSYVDAAKPGSLSELLNMHVNGVMQIKEYHGLTEKQQQEISFIVSALENISQAVDAPGQLEKRMAGTYEHKTNIFISPEKTIGSYADEILTKLKNALA